ncbi:MAG: hypothetical protein CMA12_00045 [Euryarchaeota archaeon]|nr:hypothetical protein [Euryarchaeota archaeon]|tara:strand:- start:440 stop:1108 length:669 start_codon:yes stop_codon:yes gene_type:complete
MDGFDISYIFYLFQNNQDIFLKIIFTIISGFIIRTSLSITGQIWVRTQHQTLTYLILPFISFVIASVIMNNIALSLGMIGALSIVRFRNPVKSPFELVMFFALLTLGISISVDLKWGLIVIFFLLIIIFFAHFYERILLLLNKRPFNLSFEEGSSLNFLEITSSNEINSAKKHKSLIHFHFSKNDSSYNYKFAFENKRDLDAMHDKISDNLDIIGIEIKYSN